MKSWRVHDQTIIYTNTSGSRFNSLCCQILNSSYSNVKLLRSKIRLLLLDIITCTCRPQLVIEACEEEVTESVNSVGECMTTDQTIYHINYTLWQTVILGLHRSTYVHCFRSSDITIELALTIVSSFNPKCCMCRIKSYEWRTDERVRWTAECQWSVGAHK